MIDISATSPLRKTRSQMCEVKEGESSSETYLEHPKPQLGSSALRRLSELCNTAILSALPSSSDFGGALETVLSGES